MKSRKKGLKSQKMTQEIVSSRCLEMDDEMASSFAGFPTCFAQNSAHAGSVILDCMLSLDSGFIDDITRSVLRSIYSITI